MKAALYVVIALLSFFAAGLSLAADGTLAPINLAARSGKSPIVDDNTGLVSYIIDLVDHLQDQFPTTVSGADSQSFSPRHSPQAINMVRWYEQQYGFQHTDMTSWVGNSFTAYLTQAQIDALRSDPNVVLVTENTFLNSSVTMPPWYDTTHSSSQPPYTETSSWGRNAVNGKISNNTYRIYTIDT